jgi:hypothetical protein
MSLHIGGMYSCDIYVHVSQGCIQAAQEERLGNSQQMEGEAPKTSSKKSVKRLLDAPNTGRAKGKSKSSKQVEGSSEDKYEFVKPSLDYSSDTLRRKRKARSGNPLITVVDVTGICEMEVLPCVCHNAPPRHEQLLRAGLFPSSFEEPETVFTFMVLDDYLIDNLECKTTGQKYYSKLQSITNQMFPYRVPVCPIAFCIFACAHTYHRIYTDNS